MICALKKPALGLLAVFAGSWAAFSSEPKPPAPAEIVERVANAATNSRPERQLHYQFTRSILTDYLDQKGEINDHGTRDYEVKPVNGRLVPVLVLINGKTPTEAEKTEWTQRAVSAEKRREMPLSRELLNHFTFGYITNETLVGRDCFILSFEPNKSHKADGLMDRILSQLHGRLWIDQQDYQLAKADIHLIERVSFWAGFGGVLDQLDLVLARNRIEPGLWLTRGSYIELKGRKVLSPFHFRSWEQCDHFIAVSPSEPKAADVARSE